MKLTKRQRSKLISPVDRIKYERMDLEEVLAVHDLMHDLMLRKAGTQVRDEFARRLLSPLPSPTDKEN